MSRFNKILNRQLTRKEFMKVLLASIMAAFGLPALMGILSGKDKSDNELPGYGTQNYGP